MVIDVRYFASVRERLGLEQERLELPAGVGDIAGLESHLAARGGAWTEVFSGEGRLLCARNQAMARRTTALAAGDEIAFFPPVTGG